MVKPFTPTESIESKVTSLPDDVIEAVNELLAENINEHGQAQIKQRDVESRIKTKMKISTKWFNQKWLDIEPLYRQYGWNVSYDKPGYNESYDAFYEFTKK